MSDLTDDVLATSFPSQLPPEEPWDLSQVRKDLAEAIYSNPQHDDGSYAPLLIRFAWHCSGTYDQNTDTGGSNGSTMRFDVEQADPENAGLATARQLLEPFRSKYPWLSYADLWILAGYVSIEASGGPHIPFSYGRVDYTDEEAMMRYGPGKCPFGDGQANNPCGSRLPAADLGRYAEIDEQKEGGGRCPIHIVEKKTIDGIRGVFTRMGLSDKETVCLILLGHQYGRCHLENSGYQHPWYVFGPTEWSAYESGLGYPSIYQFAVAQNQMKETMTPQKKRQYELWYGGSTEPFMMLPADMALWWDPEYRQYVIHYDENRRAFREDAVTAFTKLTELGCKQLKKEKPIVAQRSSHRTVF